MTQLSMTPLSMTPVWTIGFVVAAVVAVGGALLAATLKNLVHCALSLAASFAGVALIYLALDAQFVGFAQILVYIGAVAILIVFAILLTRGSGTELEPAYARHRALGLVLSAAVFALFGWAVWTSLPAVAANVAASAAATAAPQTTVLAIGRGLMTDYVLPLEIVAVLLTVALIGAVIVAMPEKKGAGK